MTSHDHIQLREREATLEIALNRPSAKNAITRAMYEAMNEALDRARDDDAIRAVILCGEGGTFTSGNDLMDFAQSPPSGRDNYLYQFLLRLLEFPKPLIAAVEGWAVGIGTTMLFHCDLAYADEGARFQMPFVQLALVPEAGCSHLLPQMVGHRRASEILFFNEKFDAHEARSIGLVNEVRSGDALDRARERADALARMAPEALRLTKQLLRQSPSKALGQAMEDEAIVFMERLRSPELAEAIAAFFEKRPARF